MEIGFPAVVMLSLIVGTPLVMRIAVLRRLKSQQKHK